MTAPIASGWSGSPGGACTHWKAPPCHGAHPQRIINYCLQLQGSETLQKLNEAKLILVGQGGVGKTSLVKRIMGRNFDENEDKTEGISIDRWIMGDDGDDNLIVNIWDFGGQEIMHSTHQFFLTKRSLYLIVIDARQGEHENRLEYWLKLTESFGATSPAIIVINKFDQHPLDINRRGLKSKYPFILDFFAVSCKTDLGIADLIDTLKRALRGLQHVNDLLPDTWAEVKRILGNMNHDYISLSEYRSLCKDCGLADQKNQNYLIDLLHDLGIVVNFRQDFRLKNTNVLNPEWVTSGVYKLLNSFQLFQSKGVLHLNMLTEILDNKRYPDDTHLFLINLMEKFELCLEFEDSQHLEFLIPDLLQKEEPELNWNLADSLAFQFRYDVLPSSILSRLIVKLRNLIAKRTYWRSGVVLSDELNRCLVKSDEEEGIVYVWVSGNMATRRSFLQIVRQALRDINRTIPKLVVTEKVPYSGVIIDYAHLLTLESIGEKFWVPEGLNRKVSVRALLEGIDVRPKARTLIDEGVPARTRRTRARALTQTKETNVKKIEKLSVFVSYSHKDIRHLRRMRPHLVPLERENKIELWDDTRILAGDQWKGEIEKALVQASIAVLFISADFLASEFIISNELPRLLEMSERTGTVIIPIIIKACGYSTHPVLSTFQALNDPRKPVSNLSVPEQEMVYSSLAERIASELTARRRMENAVG